jgi:hypothetical protein
MANTLPAVRQGIIAGTVSVVWSKAVLPWVLSAGAPMVTAYLGWAQGVPWMWVWMAALASPFFVLAGLREFETRRQLNQIDGKLTIELGAAFESELKEGKRIVKAIQPFVQFVNTAPFRLSLIVDEMTTHTDDHAHRYRPGIERATGPFAIEPATGMQSRDIIVEVPGGIEDERFTGVFRFRLRYGLPGKEIVEVVRRTTFEAANVPNVPLVQMFFSPAVGAQ